MIYLFFTKIKYSLRPILIKHFVHFIHIKKKCISVVKKKCIREGEGEGGREGRRERAFIKC